MGTDSDSESDNRMIDDQDDISAAPCSIQRGNGL